MNLLLAPISITIPRKIKSQNQRDSSHWTDRGAERNVWFTLIRMRLIPKNPPAHKVKVSISSYRARLLDFANLVGGSKQIPDILKALGYIKDDSPHWFECTYHQEQVPKDEERTVIYIHNPSEPMP